MFQRITYASAILVIYFCAILTSMSLMLSLDKNSGFFILLVSINCILFFQIPFLITECIRLLKIK
jgi:hypothetical protein